MTLRTAACLAAACALLLGGCAPGVWLRPGVSAEEAQQTLAQCNYEASMATSPSQFRVRSRPHHGGSLAAGIATGLAETIIQGIDEAARTEALNRRCMTANGYRLVPVETARAMAQAASAPAVPLPPPVAMALAPPPVATAPPGPPPVVLAVPIPPAAPAMLPVRLASARPLPPPGQSLEPPRPAIRRGSNMSVGYLLGACSAGDMSACLTARAVLDEPPQLY